MQLGDSAGTDEQVDTEHVEKVTKVADPEHPDQSGAENPHAGGGLLPRIAPFVH